jgi:hypothetical protein
MLGCLRLKWGLILENLGHDFSIRCYARTSLCGGDEACDADAGRLPSQVSLLFHDCALNIVAMPSRHTKDFLVGTALIWVASDWGQVRVLRGCFLVACLAAFV